MMFYVTFTLMSGINQAPHSSLALSLLREDVNWLKL